MSEILVKIKRGEFVESVHRGSVAVADTSGNLVAWAGDPEIYTFMRSSAKPIQALAVVETGAYDAYGLDERELAITSASHSSEAFHVETVLAILRKLGVSESRLQCGTHLPTHGPSADELIRQGRQPTPVHCNCSGKHAGMLAVAKRMGWTLEGYWQAEHPVQRLCLANVASVSGYPAAKIGVAKDGCGVTVFALPLRHMAQAFARMANPDDPPSGFSPERVRAASLIIRAMREHPEMVGGTGRLCTELMRKAPLVAKSGAEGVYCVGVPGRSLGVALKIEDGNSRAVGPAILRALEGLGLLDPEAAAALEPFRRPVGLNHRGETIGVTEADFELKSK